MKRATIFSDSLTKAETRFHWDHDSIVIENRADVGEVIEDNRRMHAMIDERAKWGEWAQVASIPMNIYMELQRVGIADDEKALRKWLDDRDNSVFRTRPGKLSR